MSCCEGTHLWEGPRREVDRSVLAGCGQGFCKEAVWPSGHPGRGEARVYLIFRFTLYWHTLESLCCVSGAAVTLGEIWYVVGPALPM